MTKSKHFFFLLRRKGPIYLHERFYNFTSNLTSRSMHLYYLHFINTWVFSIWSINNFWERILHGSFIFELLTKAESFTVFSRLSLFSRRHGQQTALQDRERVFSLEQMAGFFVVKYNKDNAPLLGKGRAGFLAAHCRKLVIPRTGFCAVTESRMGDSSWGEILLQLWTCEPGQVMCLWSTLVWQAHVRHFYPKGEKLEIRI